MFAAKDGRYMDKARQYIDECKRNQTFERESHNSKHSSKRSSRLSKSMTSSQHQRALDLAKMKTAELVQQSEAALKIAEQKRKAEEQRLKAEFDEIAEQQRQRVAEAKLAEAELETMLDLSRTDVDSTSSVPSDVDDQASRIKHWVSDSEDVNLTTVTSATVPGGGSQNIAAHIFLTVSHPLKTKTL